MTMRRNLAIACSAMLMTILLLASAAQAQKKGKYACDEPNPESLCTAANTCGGGGSPCNVDVNRTANGAAAKASIQSPKDNALFCVKVGTTVTFTSSQKNTGFLVDFGPNSPFDPPDAINGGSKAPASVTAARPGCFKYSAGACSSGAIYGMCKTAQAEAIVVK